jgi:hypothetical protein
VALHTSDPITCPNCNHFEVSPPLAIEKNRHDVLIKNAFDAQPHVEKLWLPCNRSRPESDKSIARSKLWPCLAATQLPADASVD